MPLIYCANLYIRLRVSLQPHQRSCFSLKVTNINGPSCHVTYLHKSTQTLYAHRLYVEYRYTDSYWYQPSNIVNTCSCAVFECQCNRCSRLCLCQDVCHCACVRPHVHVDACLHIAVITMQCISLQLTYRQQPPNNSGHNVSRPSTLLTSKIVSVQQVTPFILQIRSLCHVHPPHLVHWLSAIIAYTSTGHCKHMQAFNSSWTVYGACVHQQCAAYIAQYTSHTTLYVYMHAHRRSNI